MDSKAESLLPVERKHHNYSPSQLQGLEQCPCYRNRDNVQNERSIAGTLAHKVVETGQDDARLDDADAAAAAQCMDFADSRLRLMLEARAAAVAALGVPDAEQQVPQVIELGEEYLPIDDCEHETPSGEILKATTAGYIDRGMVSHDRLEAEVMDFKFGRWSVEKAENNLQGIAYTLGMFKRYPTLQRVKFWFYQPSCDTMRGTPFKRADIPALYTRVLAVVERARRAREADDFSQARPSVPLCAFCANIARCPAVTKMALKVSQKFSPLEFPESITPGALLDKNAAAKALQFAQVVKVWAEAFRARITDRVISGEMTVPEGYEIVQSSEREIVDPEKYKTVALRHLTPEEYEQTLKQTFGKVEEKIKEKAPRGSKTAAVESFQEELKNEGAVAVSQPFVYLKVVPK